MRGVQTIKKLLGTINLTLGTTPGGSVSFRDMPTHIGRGFAHLAGLLFELDIDPTFTAAPTLEGLHNAVNRLEISDGRQIRFSGSLNDLRNFEILESGGPRTPDPDTNSGSTNNFHFERLWTPGPMNFAGGVSDFALICAALGAGEVRVTSGALTDVSADTTACTVVIRVYGLYFPREGQLRVAPHYERRAYTGAGNAVTMTGDQLIAFLSMHDSSAYGAIAAGDFGAISLDGGEYLIVPAVDAEGLTRAYRAEMNVGHLSPVQGEPRSATDDNAKIVNSGTPTALLSATANFQPVVWCADGQKISKIVARAKATAKLEWAGTQSTCHALVGRFLRQPSEARAEIAAVALKRLEMKVKDIPRVKTVSKKAYAGDRGEFMPWEVNAG